MNGWKALEPRDAADIMRGYERRWWIGGGWALDLFLGRRTRPHDDVDVVVLRSDQDALYRHLPGWDIRVAHEGRLRRWQGERLDLPVHALWARRTVRDAWELELLLMESSAHEWRFRRDERITLELGRIGLERDGVPFLAPEIPLLYKSREPRERDDADFTAVVPHLPAERRRWLAEALRSQEPAHAWLDALAPR